MKLVGRQCVDAVETGDLVGLVRNADFDTQLLAGKPGAE
jgi:hypothetical protein